MMMKMLQFLTLVWALMTCCCLADHSIMELIDIRAVEKMMADRQRNVSDSLDVGHVMCPTSTLPDHVEDEKPEVFGNSVAKIGKRLSQGSIPDINTVLTELRRPDKLKTDQPGMLVTKKDYIQKDWCRTEPIVQKIREDGCTPKNIINKFCYGQCNSFYIPRNLSPRRGKRKRLNEIEESPAFRSCGVCKPKKTVWVQVTLHCPGTEQPLRRRKIQKVKQCQCMPENFNN